MRTDKKKYKNFHLIDIRRTATYSKYIFKYIIPILFFLFFLIPFSGSESFNPEDDRTIGYEFLSVDGNITEETNADYLHIWNTQDDYFFNVSSGIQFSNHFQEYWTRNIFCGGYFNSDPWICLDELPFEWTIQSDNLTYVNYTGFRDVKIAPVQLRLSINYHLKLDDKNLSVEFKVDNTGPKDVTEDLGFSWRVEDIQIDNTTKNDYIKIWNNTGFPNYPITINLASDLHNNYTNLNQTKYEMIDGSEYLRLSWNENLNYKLMIDSILSQYNAPTTLAINAGPLSVGQTKQTTMYWIDAITNVSVSTGVTADVWDDPLTWNHNFACGDDMVLIVGVATDGPDPGKYIANITYGGVHLTKLGSIAAGTDVDVEMWNLTDPACGSSKEILVSYSEDSVEEAAGISTVYYGVDHIANETMEFNWSLEGDFSTLGITTNSADEIVVDVYAVDNIDAATIYEGDNQVQRGTVDQTIVSIYTSDAYDSDGVTRIGWQIAGDEFAHIAVAMIPAVPAFTSPEINETDVFQNTDINHSITIGNNASHYIFSWNGSNNCDGVWINSTIATISPISIRTVAYNESSIGTCGGKTVGWRFYANNSVGWSESDIETYEVYSYGWLNVSIQFPTDNTAVPQNTTFDVNATVRCAGSTGAKCGTIKALARYNKSSSNADTGINTTEGATPFYVMGGEEIDTDWDVVVDEGDGVAEFCVNLQIGDRSGDEAWISYLMFETDISLNISVISLNLGTMTGDVTTLSQSVEICNYTAGSDICTVDDCTIVNLSWFPSGASRWDNISITPFFVYPNINYSVKITGTTDNDGSFDELDICWDGSGTDRVEIFAPDWSVCVADFDGYANIILYDTVTEAGANNPETSPTALSQGESWLINWTVNATGEVGAQYEIDVKFNSSYGNSSVQTNDTEDRTICIGTCPSVGPDYYFENITETVTLTESPLRPIDSFRELDFTLTTSSFLSRIAGFPKAIAELLQLSEFISRLSIFLRTITQTMTMTIQEIRNFFSFRAITESFSFLDGVIKTYTAGLTQTFKYITESFSITIDTIRGFFSFKKISEIFNISELIEKLTVSFRTIIETINLNDFITRLSTFGRSITELLNLSEFTIRLSRLLIAITESIKITDFITKTQNFVKIIPEVLNVNDFVQRISLIYRKILESINISDFLYKFKFSLKFISERINISDLIDRISLSSREILQRINITDFIARLSYSFREITERISMNDFITRIQNFVKLIIQNINITDFISRLSYSFRTILQSFNITDFLFKFKEVAKTITETLNITDITDKLTTFGRAILQSININDFIDRLSIVFREITESISILERISKTFTARVFKYISETFNVNEFISRLATFGRVILESLNINDFLFKFREVLKTITETLNINDFITRLSIFTRTITESITFLEQVSKTYVPTITQTFKYIIELLNINDFITRLSVSFRSYLQSLNVNEFVTYLKEILKTITETLNISDFINRFVSFLRTFLQGLFITDFTAKIADLYLLDLKDPTESNPVAVSGGDNITVQFNFTKFNSPITDNVNITNITVGGEECTILIG